MASSTEHIDQTWFDAANPGALHDAMRVDAQRTMAAVERRPSLMRHVAECAICTAIQAAAQNTEAGQRKIAAEHRSRRRKIVLDHGRLRELLSLPQEIEIVHVYADNAPNVVTIMIAGDVPEDL